MSFFPLGASPLGDDGINDRVLSASGITTSNPSVSQTAFVQVHGFTTAN